MLTIYRGIAVVVIAIFFSFETISCQELMDSTCNLEPIVVKKGVHKFFKVYCIRQDLAKDISFDSLVERLEGLPLDLQSRSPIGGIQTDFCLRASSFSGVGVLFEGMRINDPQTSHHNSDIPLTKYDIESIGVAPQFPSAYCGPTTIAGAIQIISKRPQEEEAVLEYSLGSFQTHNTQMSFSNKIEELGFRFSLERQQSDGFYEDTDFRKINSTLAFSWDRGETNLDTFFGYQQKAFGAYDFYTPYRGFLSQEWTKTYLLNTGLNIDKDTLVLKPAFLWRRHYDKFILDKTHRRSQYINHHRTDMYTPRLYFKQGLSNLGRLGLGVEFSKEDIKSSNLGKHRRGYQSALCDYEKELSERLSLALAQRVDFFEDFKDSYTGSISTVYYISDTSSFNLSIANSLRIPSFTELYYRDPTTEGNPNLDREKAVSYQLGYECKYKLGETGVILFFRQERGLIDWFKHNPQQAKWQVDNISGAEVKGVESYLNWHKSPLTLNFNYTYVDKRLNDLGWIYKYGPNYSKHLINALIKIDLAFGTQALVWSYKKKPARDGWFLLDAHFSCHLNKFTRVFFNLKNLLNVEYQQIEGIPQPPRYLEIGFQLRW
ncbi:MAG: TonB-dependent receptor [Candidatus Omnitrophica bacterium]|nr:TonB-dependent receptor [Candidatus Omnitrophota bacterium]